jgi:hypothetical protein
MTISAAPPAPSRATDTAQSFSDKMDAFLSWLVTAVPQMNTDISNINTFAGVSMKYTFDGTSQADADPGAGKFRLSAAAQNTSTVIRFDVTDANGVNVTAVLDALDDSTSTANKGILRLQHATDITKWITFNVVSIATPAGYRNITGTVQASSAASPFANGDSIIMSFTRTGDIGSQGPAWTGGSIANRAYTTPQTPAFGATVTIDASLSNTFLVAQLTGNVTTLTINNPADGQSIGIRFAQDATGGRTVTLPASVKAAGAQETGVSRVAWLNLTYVNSASRWEGAWMTVAP